MSIENLVDYIKMGILPIIVYHKSVYKGIFCEIGITIDNTVFLDFDDYMGSSGGFRATFLFSSLYELVDSIEQYTSLKINNWKIYSQPKKNDDTEPDWMSFRKDLYNHKVNFLTKYNEMFIGDYFWKGLYNREIKPDSTNEEIFEWFEKFILD